MIFGNCNFDEEIFINVFLSCYGLEVGTRGIGRVELLGVPLFKSNRKRIFIIFWILPRYIVYTH